MNIKSGPFCIYSLYVAKPDAMRWENFRTPSPLMGIMALAVFFKNKRLLMDSASKAWLKATSVVFQTLIASRDMVPLVYRA